MKILKAVALVAIGVSLVGSAWCETPNDTEKLCSAETAQGLCHQGAKTRGKCTWSNSACHAKCDIFKEKKDCETVQVKGKNLCKWLAVGNQGVCKPN